MILVRLLSILLDLVLLVGALLVVVYGYYWIRNSFKAAENRGRIPCPHCAELIQPEANICRFCQREVGDLIRKPKTPKGLFQ